MADQRRTGTREDRTAAADRRPVPRDPPDQQSGMGEDPWDTPGEREPGDDESLDDELPDTDESGTGKRGAARSGAVHPEHLVPDEPSA